MVIVKRGQEEMARRTERNRIRNNWRRFPSVVKFLQDHLAWDWPRIQECGTHFKDPKESPAWPGLVKIDAYYCHRLPWCLNCVERERWRRVQHALDAIEACTPAGKQPAMIHIVQTAPTGEAGASWGYEASRDVKAFRSIVWKQLVHAYGSGIGGVLSYQDFGEQAFAKRHPHMDLTLSGWRLADDGPVPLRDLELAGPEGKTGKRRWDEEFAQRATRFRLDAGPGNVKFTRRIYGRAAYLPVMKYQMREMVDLRKIEYRRTEGIVEWKNYRDNTRTQFTVRDFCAGIAEYAHRLQQWKDRRDGEETASLHVRHGILAQRGFKEAVRRMGGNEPVHRTSCKCHACNDWFPVLQNELEPQENWIAA